MAKVRRPLRFSKHFGIAPALLRQRGVLDPMLNADTKLFIDPLLLRHSQKPELRTAATTLRSHFEKLLKLLRASTAIGDLPWRAAERLATYHELAATCLGYGDATIRGSAFGAELRTRLLRTAKQIIDLGIEDPDIFLLLPLLEGNVGADRISDMTAAIVVEDLASFTERLVKDWPTVPSVPFTRGARTFSLPRNPTATKPMPVLLVPFDVLRPLPLASDWDGVADAAAANDALRARVNQQVGDIWAAATRREKARLREKVLASADAVRALLEVLASAKPGGYDPEADAKGVIGWLDVMSTVASDHPLALAIEKPLDADGTFEIVRQIVSKFQWLIEKRRLSQLLWHNSRPRPERSAQLLFFGIAFAYCEANNLDITPEADTGTGSVDFKFSSGFRCRVLVELKLSTNPRLVHGYETQLELYKEAEQTTRALFLVVDVGGMGTKDEQLFRLKNERAQRGEAVSDIVIVDGTVRASASVRPAATT